MSLTLLQEMPAGFGRHQTFTIRYTWLKSAFNALLDDPRLFSGDAYKLLGVGKNMARSMRFWVQATGVCVEANGEMRPTEFGRYLLADDGLDPFLEAEASWWLLHWKLVAPYSHLPAWWAGFHGFQSPTFTVDQLTAYVANQLAGVGKKAPASTLRRDILALVRNYSGETGAGREKADDRIDLPFAQLGLVRAVDSGTFRFLSGPKPGLAPEVVLFATIEFLEAIGYVSDSVLVGTLALDAGGPGRAFRLTERDLTALYREAETRIDGIKVITSNGADQLIIEGTREAIAQRALLALYQQLGLSGRHVPAPRQILMAGAPARGGEGDE